MSEYSVFDHDSFEESFRSNMLNKFSVIENYIDIICAAILAKNIDMTGFLKGLVFESMNAEKKIKIFKEIMKKFYPDELTSKLLDGIEEIKNIRNKIAHSSIADSKSAKIDMEKKQIRLTVLKGFEQHSDILSYDTCTKLGHIGKATCDNLEKISRAVLSKEFPDLASKLESKSDKK